MRASRPFRLLVAVAIVAALAWLLRPDPGTREATRDPATSTTASALPAFLPAEAGPVIRRIQRGGTFPNRQDGSVFGNREHRLPERERGYYREYTVPTPGARDRGARRLVCGGRQPRNPDACFYTDDHYASFRRVLP